MSITKAEAQQQTREYVLQVLEDAWKADASACVIVVLNRDMRGYVRDVVSAKLAGEATPRICVAQCGPEDPETTRKLTIIAMFHAVLMYVKSDVGMETMMPCIRTWCRQLANSFARRLR